MSLSSSPASPDLPPGPALALLLLASFRAMVGTATTELAKRGHPDVRAGHEFAMRAILGGSDSAAALAETLGTTKQAAAKTIGTLEARGYVTREVDPADGRRKPLLLTPRGHDMLTQGQAILDETRRALADRVGEERLADAEGVLRLLIGGSTDDLPSTAWLATEE